MKRLRARRAVALLAAAILVAGVSRIALVTFASSVPDVTTAAYDNLRTDWDPNEPALSPAAVQSGTFGRLFSTALDGQVYAQPLAINNTVIVTTEKATAYGINATTGAVIWKHHFGKPMAAATIGCTDLTPYVGSTSTPVEDPSTGIVYLTTRLEKGTGLTGSEWFLQAVIAATGKEVPGYPVRLVGTPYNTPGVPFADYNAMQRPALLLLNGVVYIAFASNCDFKPYRGIVMGVNVATRAITTMWSDESGIGTDQNSQAGIWQSGGGLVSDGANNIILATGNGESSTPAPSNQPPPALSEAVIALSVQANGQLTPTQFFSPSNTPTLDADDEDLGSGGPVVLPQPYFGTAADPNLVVQTGKDGRLFLLNADDMGGMDQGPGGSDDAVQTLGPFDPVWGHPAAYGGEGGWVYVLGSGGGGYLRALSYGVDGQGVPQLTPAGISASSFAYGSGSPMVTSNGTAPGSAVVWAVDDSGGAGVGQLRAYGAIPSGGILPLLWSAPIGVTAKFTVPTAYNGRVYVGTASKLIAFGSATGSPIQAAPVPFGSVPVGRSRTLTVSASVTRSLTITGPVTLGGYEATSLPSAAADVGGTTQPPPSTATAGPKVIPPPGATPITAGKVFSIEQPRVVGTPMPAGSTVQLRVTFTPRHAGPVVAWLTIPTNAGTRTVSVTGYGTSPGLLISARPLDFGTIDTGAGGDDLTVTFSNCWDDPETFTAFNLPGGPFTVTGLPRTGTVLGRQQAVTASVRFNPTRAGDYRSHLTISTDHGTVRLPVGGRAVTGYARLVVSKADVDAGRVPVGHAVGISFDVGNTGTVPLEITRAIPPGGPFSTSVPMPEGITLDPGTFLHQHVTFRPAKHGHVSARYIFAANDGQGYVSVALTGTGI